MKKILFILLTVLALLVIIRTFSLEPLPPSPPLIHLKIGKALPLPPPHRIGINLGQWRPEGAQQYAHNILMNPGFEGQIDRILTIVSLTDLYSFSDEAGWGYPDGTWNEAAFHILTGKSANREGTVTRSLNSGKEGFPQYFSKNPLPPLEPHDLITLTKINRPDPPSYWQVIKTPLSQTTIDPFTRRPGSSGSQSLRILPGAKGTAGIETYLDILGKKAPKLLPLSNQWRFSFWAKGEKPGDKLRAFFGRLNESSPFFDQIIILSPDWQEYIIDFYPQDQGDPAPLRLSLSASHSENSIWVDDLFLGTYPTHASFFRKEVAFLLKKLHPSFLREFPSLGDTWENRIADPFERKSWLLRLSAGRNEPIYNYSLPEFFQLCEEVGANPWLILPPPFSDHECREMGKYLMQFASKKRFSEVILEFGHENWNWTFRPAEIPYAYQQGKRARQVFEIIRKTAGKEVHLKTLVNGPSQSLEAAFEFLQATPNADGIALAPYFFYSLSRSTPDEEILNLLFQENENSMDDFIEETLARDRQLSISEINLHTTQGTAKGYERNRAVTGAASGSALAKQLLQSLLKGIDPIAVYTFSQYNTAAWETQDFVNLWGITRDLGPPPRLRPTGLAIQLLNEVIQGDVYSVEICPNNFKNWDLDKKKEEMNGEEREKQIAQKLTLAAFKSDTQWSLAIVSAHPFPVALEMTFPDDEVSLPSKHLYLEAASPFDTNEEEEKVKIAEILLEPKKKEKRTFNITVPAWGLSVLK